ncbi:hypothetical protein QVD17_04956 [Tagetes erecta]|uniref:Uncharacterized protein n=1 Tax=Tagetes erecta TaxID=13708 RepID=A0AAD8PB25_TARER|nr:hypothetical protein QVD17_04956 [Tagetes erecta]
MTTSSHVNSSLLALTFVPHLNQSTVFFGKVGTMTLSKKNTENTPAQTVMTSPVDTKYCNRKRCEEAGFMDNAMENMKSFFQASLDDHKACFKASWHKMVERFQEEKSAGFEGQNTTSKN